MAAKKDPTLCVIVAPTWEDPKRTITIRQSGLDELNADLAARAERLNAAGRGEIYVSNAEHAEWEVLARYLDDVKEAIHHEEMLAQYNYEDPCVARHA